MSGDQGVRAAAIGSGDHCYEDLRWSRFKDLGSAQEMYDVVDTYVFPFLQERAQNSTHATHMNGARLTIPTPESSRIRHDP